MSSYPVKPRKVPRSASYNKDAQKYKNMIEQQQFGRIQDSAGPVCDPDDQQIQDMFRFLDSIKANSKDLHEAELQRESLENQNIAYKLRYNQTKKHFSDIKEEQENYVHILQVFYMRAIKLHKAYSYQNSMIYDMLVTLKRRNQLATSLESDTQILKAMLQPAKRGPVSKAKEKEKDQYGLVEGETSVLRVELKKSGKNVILYKNMFISTPMGEGQIVTILPRQQKVAIKLSFGTMYSHLARVVSWCQKGDYLDCVSDRSLYEEWNSIKNNINVTWRRLQNIRSIVDPMEEVEHVTDGDDDNSIDESAGENELLQMLTVPAPTTSVPMETQNTADGSFQINIGSYKTIDPENRLFPIKLQSNLDIPIARDSIKKSIYEDFMNEPLPLSTISLASVPPAATPYVIEKLYKEGSINTVLSRQALQDGGIAGTTGALGWVGDIEELKKGLQSLGNKISCLEAEQRSYIENIESSRRKCTSYYQDTAAIRLGIYTRRFRHRSILQSSGIHAGTVVSSPSLQAPQIFPNTEKIADNTKPQEVLPITNDSTEPGKKRTRESPPQARKENAKIEKDSAKTRRGRIEEEKQVEVRIDPIEKKEEAPEPEEKKRMKRARRI